MNSFIYGISLELCHIKTASWLSWSRVRWTMITRDKAEHDLGPRSLRNNNDITWHWQSPSKWLLRRRVTNSFLVRINWSLHLRLRVLYCCLLQYSTRERNSWMFEEKTQPAHRCRLSLPVSFCWSLEVCIILTDCKRNYKVYFRFRATADAVSCIVILFSTTSLV